MIWETVNLGKLCEILDTLRKPINKKFRKHGQYPYYGASGIVDYVDNYIFNETLVLIGEDGAKWGEGEQTAFIVSGKYWVNNHAHVIKPDENKLNQKFLVYYLNLIDLKPWVTGLTVPKLNQEKLKSIPIPLPSLTEQKHIVTKLDEAFTEINKVISNTMKSTENAEKLYQQTVSSIFNKKGPTWQSTNMRETCLFIQGVQVPIEEQSKIKDDTYNTRFLRIIDFTQGNVEPRYIKRRVGNLKNFSKNDIALVRYGASTGFVCSGLEGQIANNMFKVIPQDSLFETDYLKFFLNSSIFKNFINTKISGAAMPAINFEMFNDFKIAFPKNVEERQLLVKKARKILEEKNRLVGIYANKLINLEALKLAISSQELKSKAA